MSGAIGSPGFVRSGSLTTGQSSDWYPIWFPFNIFVSGTWSGTWSVEATPDDGATVYNCTVGGAPSSYSSNGLFVASNVFQKGVQYRITRSAGTGTMAFSIQGQGAPA